MHRKSFYALYVCAKSYVPVIGMKSNVLEKCISTYTSLNTLMMIVVSKGKIESLAKTLLIQNVKWNIY